MSTRHDDMVRDGVQHPCPCAPDTSGVILHNRWWHEAQERIDAEQAP